MLELLIMQLTLMTKLVGKPMFPETNLAIKVLKGCFFGNILKDSYDPLMN